MLYLGIIIGLLIAIIILLGIKRFQTPVERTLKQLENRVKEKGEIYIETDEEKDFKNFINNLPTEE